MRILLLLPLLAALGCSTTASHRGEVDLNAMPEDLRVDYDLFRQRCSKCHALQRVWDSGIQDDEFWDRYVERMRRQPASGISPDDGAHIVTFLHYYSRTLRAQKSAREK
jgi:hypothetical protein